MIKNILACVDSSKYAEAVSGASLWLAKELGAKVHAISVVEARLLEGPWLADLSGVTGAQPFQALAPQLRELYENKARAAIDRMRDSAAAEKVPCQAEVRTGTLVDEILDAERTAELVILGQRGEGYETTGEWLGSNMERVLRKSIKPCLVTPLEFRPIRRILAAYDGSQHANHALYVAFDLTRSLKAELSILAVEQSTDEAEKSWALKEAMDLADQQGVKAHAMALHGSPEDKILEISADKDVDLIIMGAYGHTRLRELVLGSVTSQVIRKSSKAVLLAR